MVASRPAVKTKMTSEAGSSLCEGDERWARLRRRAAKWRSRCLQRATMMAWSATVVETKLLSAFGFTPSRVGLKDESALKKAEKLAKKKQFKMNKMGKASESDRRIAIKKPRHLFSGKRGNGKTDRR